MLDLIDILHTEWQCFRWWWNDEFLQWRRLQKRKRSFRHPVCRVCSQAYRCELAGDYWRVPGRMHICACDRKIAMK